MKKLLFSLIVAGLLTATAYGQSNSDLKAVDLLIKNGMVITMDSNRALLETGAVAVANGTIVAVGTSAALEGKFKAKKNRISLII